MKFQQIAAHLDGIPYTSPQKGQLFYNFILANAPRASLELGFAHGVSSCYIAAALAELGSGHLTCVDLEVSKTFTPSIETLLDRTGLSSYVTVAREKTGYNWFLKKKIEERSVDTRCEPCYDFCFIDGAKNWTIDGFAFFLVDKLLKTPGWLLFDDYSWSYADQQARTGKTATAGIEHQQLSEEEFHKPHIAEIFQYLVMQHPGYSHFRIVDDQLAYAQKAHADARTLRLESAASIKYKLIKLIRGLKRNEQTNRS